MHLVHVFHPVDRVLAGAFIRELLGQRPKVFDQVPEGEVRWTLLKGGGQNHFLIKSVPPCYTDMPGFCSALCAEGS